MFRSIVRRRPITVFGILLNAVLFLLLCVPHLLHAQLGVVTTLAGSIASGYLDGTGTGARFSQSWGVCSDGAGNLFVADFANHRIRKIVIGTGVVTTFAGDGTPGNLDGTGTAARFANPRSLCSDGLGNLFVSDQSNGRIRKIVIATGVVTTIAGSTSGYLDGTGTAARFSNPVGVCYDGAGNLFVADNGNTRIRKIVVATAEVTTLAGSTSGFADGLGTAARFASPAYLTLDGSGNLFVADSFNRCIRQIVIATGFVTTLAGSGVFSYNDGVGTNAQFSAPQGIVADGTGNLYVSDPIDRCIRRIVIATGTVTTMTGTFGGLTDGTGAIAQMSSPFGLTLDGVGNLYIGDGNSIRKLSILPASAVFSGTTFPEAVANDGSITQTRDITITGDTWIPSGAFTAGTHFVATGVPSGLTISVNRISPTVARISFTGNAAAHAAANNTTFTLRFTDAAFGFGIASAVMVADATAFAGGTPTSYAINFTNPPMSATYTAATFPEAPANNGSITTTQDVTLTGDTWVPAGAFALGTDFTATGVPAGLTIAINRISATVARISFTGAATAHANANDATVTLNFTNAALTGANAAGVTGLNPAVLTLDFNNPPTAARSSTIFVENAANDGSITETHTITLTGETWNTGIADGTNFTAGTHFTVANVSAGLTMVIQKTSANVATISFTGNAVAHEFSNSIFSTQITWLAAATQAVAPAFITGLNGVNWTLYYFDPPTAAYSATTFPEVAANDGSITQNRTITLTGETWNTGITNGTNFTAGTHFTAANVPGGLTMVIQKTSANLATVSFTGNATAHANANDISNVQITWLAAATQAVAPAFITSLNGVNLTLDFNDPPTAAYSGTSFVEVAANDGSITQTRTVTLTGETWNSAIPNGTNFTGGVHFNAASVPPGLLLVMQKTSANVATIMFTGNAGAHANANDVGTLPIIWLAGATQSVSPTLITGLNGANLSIDFNDPATAAYSATTFPEAIANDGSITQTRTVTLTGETWNTGIANGTNFTAGTHYTALNVPAGLTMVIQKTSANLATVSFTGNATAHANVNDVSNLQITWLAAATQAVAPTLITGLNGVNLTLDFNDPGGVVWSGTTFAEAAANNGMVTATQTVTLTSDNWNTGVANGTNLTLGTHYSVVNVPAGLTMVITKNSATQVTVSFTGTAAAHANANDVANAQITFLNAAVNSGNASGNAGLNGINLTLDFNDPATAAYSAITFPEAIANDGSITQNRTVTLTGETWNTSITNGINFTAGTHFTATNVPTGLTMVIQKTSANLATVSFTGNATAHANANDVNNVQITWLAAATQAVAPTLITGLNGVNLTLDFNDPGGVVWSGMTFAEAAANDGTITATQTVTLSTDAWNTGVANGATFTAGTHFTAANVPAGLTMVITKNSVTQVTVSFIGTAAAHANANDVANVQITFLNASVNSGNANGNAGLNGMSLTLDFNDPYAAAYSGTTFPEAAANNGTITQTRTITLTGDTWIPAGAFTGGGTHFTATGIPVGLAIVITRITPTIAEISFTGTAAAHANANDATVTLNFTNAALTSNNAAGITGLNPASLTLDFADATATLTGSAFPEAAANNGSITTTQDITLAGDLWTPAGAFANPAEFTATGVPAGLTVAVQRISATVARISFTGAATAHTAANNTSVTLNFTNAALAGANVGVVTGLNPVTLALTFLNPPAPPTPPAPAPVLPTAPTAFQLGAAVTLQASFNLPYGLSLIANGAPAPAYSLVGGALPPGVTLSSSGMLSGTPTQQGGYTFTVEASNSAGSTQTVVTLVVGPPRPLATFVEQTTGGIGTVIVIRGYNLSNALEVSFGGVSALRFTVDNDSQITAIVGFGNSGAIQVTTPNGVSVAPQGFTYIAPQAPAITSINPAAAVSGDENYSIVLRGRNFSPFATYLVQPETGTSASFAVPLETVQEFVSSTEAYLRLPFASRTLGIKRVVVRLGDAFASATFAVVPGAKPEILSFTVPSTTASSHAFTTELVGRTFFRRGFATITVNGGLAKATVLDSNRARVEIPAVLNVLGSRVVIRLTNYDGQFSEGVVNVVSRIAPLVLSVKSRVENGRTRLTVKGSGFWGIQRVTIQNRAVLLVRTSPAELELELPSDFPRPKMTEEAWVLMIENPDGQVYGFRLAPNLFYPNSAAALPKSNTTETHSSASSFQATGVNSASMLAPAAFPNPASDIVHLSGVEFANTDGNDVRLSIVNSLGVILYEQTVSASQTAGRVSLDVRDLADGAYLIVLTKGTERRSVRFVKR